MQSKGWIRFVAILLGIASIWQLSFTAVTRYQESKAAKYAEAMAQQFVEANNVPAEVLEYVKDSVANNINRVYLDSLNNEKVYLWYPFKSVKEKEINLGLDLKGGMNVMLQVQLEDVLKALAANPNDPDFVAAMEMAKKENVNDSRDFIGLFESAWNQVAPQRRLNEIFATTELRDKISNDSSNGEVITALRAEAKSAIDDSFNVLRKRIDRLGVTQPNIQQVSNTGKILIELPGVKDPERVRKLLQGTASLEFWPTFTAQEIDLGSVNARVSELLAGEEGVGADPLYSVLLPTGGGSACLGYASSVDTATVNKYLALASDYLPAEFRGAWSVKPVEQQYDKDGNPYYSSAVIGKYELVALKVTDPDGNAPLDGSVVTDTRVNFNGSQRGGSGAPSVSMTMNREGANIWANLTKDNIGRQVAIVLDGLVYSYPNVLNAITGGSSEITGNFTVEEAEDLANVLKAGKLRAPATIIQEQVVGPSLGSASIRAGLISFLIAFILVLIYMVLFYRGAGLIADVALLCNVLLLFGVLVSFGAVLTLPGIAGLVLTLGMAVDANVIIYERVKEELRAGKSLRLAISDGYKNAYSAIIDGQLTTLITGVILYFFGSGPVKGFAAVLVIGIITSVFTSIFIPRLIFEARLARNKDITFDSPATRNFLQNTHVDFIKLRKISYIVSGILCLIALVSIFTKGFSYGVDFSGGRTYVVRFDQPTTAEAVRAATLEEFGEAAEVKQFGGASQMRITTKYKVDDRSQATDKEIEGKIYNALRGFFANQMTQEEFTSTLNNPNGIISSDRVDASIASEMQRDAVIAVILALIAIFGYIAIRFTNWTWGVGGVASLVHNALIMIGFFSLFSGILPFTLDVDQTFIAAILTIIGYSINDNVVIFDRIREYKALYPKRSLKDNVNDAVNATLSRTLNTSITTLIVLLAIAIFGGESIRGFAVALTLGVIVGTYASIFIGTPIMYDLNRKREAKAAEKAVSKK